MTYRAGDCFMDARKWAAREGLLQEIEERNDAASLAGTKEARKMAAQDEAAKAQAKEDDRRLHQ